MLPKGGAFGTAILFCDRVIGRAHSIPPFTQGSLYQGPRPNANGPLQVGAASPHLAATKERVAALVGTVLIVHDTIELDYSNQSLAAAPPTNRRLTGGSLLQVQPHEAGHFFVHERRVLVVDLVVLFGRLLPGLRIRGRAQRP